MRRSHRIRPLRPPWCRRLAGCGAALAGGAACLTAAAHAQTAALPGTNEVLSRGRPGYDAKGLPLGALRLYPTINATLAYDDNVFNSDQVVASDRILTIAPAVSLRSDWSRHDVQIDANMRVERYARTSIQNNEQYGLRARGRLDVSRAITVNATAHAERSAEPRGSLGDVFIGGQSALFRTFGGTLGTTIAANHVTLGGTAQFDRFRYSDVRVGSTTFSQRYRDHDTLGLSGNAGLLISPSVTLFATAAYNRQRYAITDPTFPLDAQGFNVQGGVGFEVTRLIFARASVGYLRQTFADPRVGAISGLAYDADIHWNPTPLISLSLNGRRSVLPSPIVGVAGVVSSTIGVGADYELLRRLLVNANVNYAVDSYRGIDRLDRRIGGTLGVRYLLNPYLAVEGSYQHRLQRSTRTFRRDYDGNALMLTLRIQA